MWNGGRCPDDDLDDPFHTARAHPANSGRSSWPPVFCEARVTKDRKEHWMRKVSWQMSATHVVGYLLKYDVGQGWDQEEKMPTTVGVAQVAGRLAEVCGG